MIDRSVELVLRTVNIGNACSDLLIFCKMPNPTRCSISSFNFVPGTEVMDKASYGRASHPADLT